jgi:aminocarboxymuconate-semialdehyde decarboxylase
MFYVDTALNGAKHAVECAVEFFGADHVLFGTDTPFDPAEGEFIRDAINDVKALAIEEAARRGIFSGNAGRLLNLS